jgi:hypothetical protein
MNQPDVVLFEKFIVDHNQTHDVFISHHSILLRNQQGCQHVEMTAMFVESISRGLSPTFLKIWYVNHSTCLVVSMQQQQWHPTSRMTVAM